MIRRSLQQIAEMAGGRLVQGDPKQQIAGVSTDTRADLAGRLFVPLVGERFDAHDFLEQAAEAGAVAALWQKDHPQKETPLALIEVEDTLQALQRLASTYRDQLGLTVVGVTGSNGKTSTKDMISAVLAERFRVQKTLGNWNNHIGLPLMMLQLEETTEVAVLEMGMNHFGEIALLAFLAKPQIGVITNIGEAHVEFLGSRAGIAEAKCELIEALPATGHAVLFGDEPLLRERAGKTRAQVQWFGFADGNDLQAVEIENLGIDGSNFSLRGEEARYHLPIPGRHQVGNSLAAIAVARLLGLTAAEIRQGLAKAQLTARRFEVKQAKIGGLVIDDSYNASPTSMKAALQMLPEMQGGVKVAVLGGMLELGPDSPKMHREVGAFLAPLAIDQLVCIGELAANIAAGAKENGYPASQIILAADNREAIAIVEKILQQHRNDQKGPATVLVKSSLGMKLIEVVRALV